MGVPATEFEARGNRPRRLCLCAVLWCILAFVFVMLSAAQGEVADGRPTGNKQRNMSLARRTASLTTMFHHSDIAGSQTDNHSNNCRQDCRCEGQTNLRASRSCSKHTQLPLIAERFSRVVSPPVCGRMLSRFLNTVRVTQGGHNGTFNFKTGCTR